MHELIKPPVLSEAPPFTAATDHPATPVESVDDKGGTVRPCPTSSTAGTHTAEKGKAESPADTVQTIGDSGTETDKTEELEPEEDPSYSTPVFSSKSDHILWKRTHSTCCLLYTSPSPRDATLSRMPSSA